MIYYAKVRMNNFRKILIILLVRKNKAFSEWLENLEFRYNQTEKEFFYTEHHWYYYNYENRREFYICLSVDVNLHNRIYVENLFAYCKFKKWKLIRYVYQNSEYSHMLEILYQFSIYWKLDKLEKLLENRVNQKDNKLTYIPILISNE